MKYRMPPYTVLQKNNTSTISIIIATPYDLEYIPAVSHLKKIDYPQEKIEIILAIGNRPSLQRNRAAKEACGDILYFLNTDACPEADTFGKIVNVIKSDENIGGVGGPDLTPRDNGRLQHLFGYAMSSYIAHWKIRSRYAGIGKTRNSCEKELILSNLAVRRDVYLNADGFNETLYPNEENEFINRIIEKGYKFIYNPDIKIFRDRRKTVPEFVKQFYRYGKGRMNQIFVESFLKNLYFFMPVMLLVYIAVLPFIGHLRFSFVPLFIYLGAGIIDAVCISMKNKKAATLLLPLIYFIMHLSYGVGMLAAFYRDTLGRKNKKQHKVKYSIKKIKSFKEPLKDVTEIYKLKIQ